MIDGLSLSFGGETFIPIEEAQNYLDCKEAIYKLESLYRHYKGFYCISPKKNMFCPNGEEEAKELYIDGMVIVRSKAKSDVLSYLISTSTKELEYSTLKEFVLCYGTVQGKECTTWTTYPVIHSIGVTVSNTYVKQSDIEALASLYGIQKNKSYPFDNLINRYKNNFFRKIEVIARANELPDMLDIYDIATLYTNNTQDHLGIRGVIYEAYKTGLLIASKGVGANKVLTACGHKTGIRNGMIVVLPNDDLVENGHGFTVHNPTKTTPALYKKLVEHGLIKPEGLEKFKEAFENGSGVISWLTIQAQLGYFIKEIKRNGLIVNNDNWETAKNIIVVNEKKFDDKGLESLKAGAYQATKKSTDLIDRLIREILTIY